jgi:hypothetical protein
MQETIPNMLGAYGLWARNGRCPEDLPLSFLHPQWNNLKPGRSALVVKSKNYSRRRRRVQHEMCAFWRPISLME